MSKDDVDYGTHLWVLVGKTEYDAFPVICDEEHRGLRYVEWSVSGRREWVHEDSISYIGSRDQRRTRTTPRRGIQLRNHPNKLQQQQEEEANQRTLRSRKCREREENEPDQSQSSTPPPPEPKKMKRNNPTNNRKSHPQQQRRTRHHKQNQTEQSPSPALETAKNVTIHMQHDDFPKEQRRNKSGVSFEDAIEILDDDHNDDNQYLLRSPAIIKTSPISTTVLPARKRKAPHQFSNLSLSSPSRRRKIPSTLSAAAAAAASSSSINYFPPLQNDNQNTTRTITAKSSTIIMNNNDDYDDTNNDDDDKHTRRSSHQENNNNHSLHKNRTGFHAAASASLPSLRRKRIYQQRIVRDDGQLVSIFHTGHGRRKGEYALAGDSSFFGKYKYIPRQYQFVQIHNNDDNDKTVNRYISVYFSEQDLVYIPSPADHATATTTTT